MKFKKLITSSFVAASLFGTLLGSSSLSNITASASINTNEQSNGNTSISKNGTRDSLIPAKKGASSDANDKDNSKNSNSKSGTDANMNVGLLNLDSVPNLHFGSNDITKYTQTLPLQNGQSSNGTQENNSQDSTTNATNDNGMLQVNDNRNTDDNKGGPWELQASLGQFYRENDSGNPIPSTDDWSINLNNSSYINDDGNNLNMGNVEISNNGNNNYNNPKVIMSTDNDGNGNGNKGHGKNTAYYNDSNTSLTTPYNVKLGHYTASISWNLTANSDNSANSGTPTSSSH